jgi:hypothetical protein
MNRNRRLLFLLAGILSCAFPLLWTPTELTPLVVGVGWLLLGCLAGLGPPLQPFEMLLLSVLLTPGLFITLTFHADSNILQSYASVFRVLLALGLYTALTGMAEFSKTKNVPLAFVLGLERSSLLLSTALTAFAWTLLLFIRSVRTRG